MSDATYIELPAQPRKKRRFFRGWRGLALLFFLCAVAAAAGFSWWLSEGKISSVYARVDTVVYTVEPEYLTRVEKILVHQGEEISYGKPLANIQSAQVDQSQNPDPEAANPDSLSNSSEISGRINATTENERDMSNRLARARAEEERYQRVLQQRVTEHVRAQLYMRSIDPGNYMAYQQATNMEQAARARSDVANEEFEKVSKLRAAIETELGRIRYEISRRKLRGARAEQPSPKKPQPQPQLAPKFDTLYAPVSGRIMSINARPGQTVLRGQPVFVILPAGQNENWIQAWFPLSAQRMLKLGQKAIIKSGNIHLTGQVAGIGSEAQSLPTESGRQNTQYLPVRIQALEPRELGKLAPGTNVDCQIQTRYVLEGIL